jgi:serine/threonine protein phosphatase PrpC
MHKLMADNFFGITDQGKMRDNNEDRFIAQTILHKRYVLACVIDGVGGYEGGEIASGLAHDSIINYLQKPFQEIIPALKNALTAANEKIYKRKQSEDAINEMACVLTLALADIQENKFYYAHVGDTRLYLLRDNSLVKVTKDHSFVGFLEDSGRLSEADAMNHPKRNEINKAIGFDEQQFLQPDYIETGESPFLPSDILLLCSDGLSDLVDNKTMTSILLSNKTLREKGKALIKAANEAGGKDNITVALVKNDKAQLVQEATKPIPIKKNEEPQQEEEPIIEKGEPVEEPLEKPVEEIPVAEKNERKKSSGILWFLIVILLAVVAWFVYKDYLQQPPKPKAVMPAPEKKINTVEQKLTDSINNKKEISFNKIFNTAQPVVFTDSIFVDKDSLIVHGNNANIIANSSFKNAAFIFSGNCKYILIDSVTFENFNVGIVTKNKALHLKYVQFKNCKVAVRHEIFSNEKNISGKIDDSLVSLKKDSVKTRH